MTHQPVATQKAAGTARWSPLGLGITFSYNNLDEVLWAATSQWQVECVRSWRKVPIYGLLYICKKINKIKQTNGRNDEMAEYLEIMLWSIAQFSHRQVSRDEK